ncbi:MAG TPA: DEAD/DEAH box helicase [Chlamydiales bacterium]|nr:DEAD/DEAH box helicase [Chlamydiales bacterium]
MAFQKYHLLPELHKAIDEMGYSTPTVIQEQSIPLILEGSDLLAGSQTGTGKTAGFAIPMLQNLMKMPGTRKIRALILTPTRELALQVEENVRALAKNLPLKSTAIFGGVNIKSQVKVLNTGIDIIVATPGRLLDLVNQQIITLSQVKILVLDEADRMLDMGFIHDIRRILKLLPSKRQNLLFSATFSEEIKRLANGLLNSPKMIQAARINSTVDAITQIIHPVDSKRKTELLSMLIKTHDWQQALVFTRTKHGANRLTEKLISAGITAAAIHGNKSQNARVKSLEDFKNGAVRILVATDIAARGIDIDQLPQVVNFDLPNVPEDYVHRIGRTGRNGNKGQAISLVCIDEHEYLKNIERLVKHEIPKIVIPNFQPDPTIKAQPISHGRQMAPQRKHHAKQDNYRSNNHHKKPHRSSH